MKSPRDIKRTLLDLGLGRIIFLPKKMCGWQQQYNVGLQIPSVRACLYSDALASMKWVSNKEYFGHVLDVFSFSHLFQMFGAFFPFILHLRRLSLI